MGTYSDCHCCGVEMLIGILDVEIGVRVGNNVCKIAIT